MNKGQRARSSNASATAMRANTATPWHLRQWLIAALITTAVILTMGSHRAHAQAAPPSLALPPTASEIARYAVSVERPDPGVARQRPVGLDLRLLDDRSGFAPAELEVELFDAMAVTLTKTRLERRGAANFTWWGHVRGHANGHALLTVVDGQISATIELGERGTRSRYQLQSTGDGLTLLREIDASTFPDDHPALPEPVAPQVTMKSRAQSGLVDRTIAQEGEIEKADTGTTIDVMVLYSNQTALAAGTAIGAQIQQAVDTANLVYAHSGIATRLRLVHYEAANYGESGDFPTDLNRLTTGTDGYMDQVEGLRNQYGADLVSLFVENGQYCGYGWIGPSASYAFTVVNRGCASGNYSFVHEIGHNFGARHDTYVDATSTPYAYGHGWVNVGERWRDVMSYNNACAAVGVNCTRIAYFSNPTMTYGSPAEPLGTAATADVVRVHNQNAVTVANFRPAAGSACAYALSPASASVSSGTGSGTIGITTQTGCAWNAASNAAWVAVGASASGSGSLGYSYGANTGPARSGTISVGGLAFIVNQASGCAYSLGTTSASVPASGASGSTTLATAPACTWTASSSASWLTVSSAQSGAGNATITYVASANTGAARSANLTIGGRTLLVSQAAASAPVVPVRISFSPATINFGTVNVGRMSAAQTLTLTNGGTASVTITSLVVGGTNPIDFRRIGGTCAVLGVLAPGSSCTVAMVFAPTAAGGRYATLSAGTASGSASATLSATGKKTGQK